ncbi:MAG: ribosome maturation factor RimM [Pseudomonadota bacterium]|nr:ribosome maturation factor RimM [Pseudomonadota bacterium]
MVQDRKICVGMFTGAHGVKGLVRLRSFTEVPSAIFDYGPLSDEDGERSFAIKLRDTAQDHFIVMAEGILDKDAADDVRGLKLYVARSALPQPGKQEYYADDLIGLEARDGAGNSFGKVLALHDHGAGSFLEIGRSKKDSFMLPFKAPFVPEVRLRDGFLLLEVPEGWLQKEKLAVKEKSAGRENSASRKGKKA